MTGYSVRRRWLSLGFDAAVFVAFVCSAATADAQSETLVRVRSTSPSIAVVIQEAATRSTRFRGLIDTINLTDGLVYVDESLCGHSVSACLVLSVRVAGPHRLLRLLVDPRKYGRHCDLMSAIGHERRHAIEVLSVPGIKDFRSVQSFFEREGPTSIDQARFETPAAVRTGLEVLGEACGRQRQPELADAPIARVRSTDAAIAALIERAARDSGTFQRLRETIQHSNGIVYIEHGTCGHGVRACLQLSMVATGPDRFLRILVHRDRADSDVEVMGSLGHELQHAIEALSQPSITNGAQLYNFFRREAPTDNNRFETAAAINAGNAIRDELRVR